MMRPNAQLEGNGKRRKNSSLLRTVDQNDQCNVIQEGHRQKSELDTTVAGKHRDYANDEVGDDADGVLDAEGVEVGRAFEAGVDDVGEEGGGEEAEEPFAA